MSTITAKDGTQDLLQGLGHRSARRVQPQLAVKFGQLGGPDALPGIQRLSLHRP
jgi:hypothetical protein